MSQQFPMTKQQQLLQDYIAQVRTAGGDEIAHLYERVMTWYGDLKLITDQQNEIVRAASKAANLVLCTTNEDDLTYARNVLQFCVVPETHITHERRMAYIARAEAGEDVYAYGEPDSPTGIINVWDWDTRIPLFPLTQWTWEMVSCLPVMHEQAYVSGDWKITFSQHHDPTLAITVIPHTITVHIDRRPGEDLEIYGARAKRKAQELEGDLNLYDWQPNVFDGHHF